MVGRGKLKLDIHDARPDTPEEVKNLILTCTHYDRTNRLDFVEVNFENYFHVKIVYLFSVC